MVSPLTGFRPKKDIFHQKNVFFFFATQIFLLETMGNKAHDFEPTFEELFFVLLGMSFLYHG